MSKPTLRVLALHEFVTKAGEQQTIWTRVGTAWINADGSITLECHAWPLSGRLQIRDDEDDRRSRPQASQAGGTSQTRASGPGASGDDPALGGQR